MSPREKKETHSQRPGRMAALAAAPAPVGPAKDQSWSLDFEFSEIKDTEDPLPGLGGDASCVTIDSYATQPGKPGHVVVVVTCIKADGKCKDCKATVAVTVDAGTQRQKIQCKIS